MIFDQHVSLTDDLVKYILSPAIALVVGVLGVAVSWAKDLNSSARRLRQIDESTKRVEFWDAWKKAAQWISTEETTDNFPGGLDKQIREELSFSARIVIQTRTRQLGERDSVGPFRRFCLLYRMTSESARSLRIFAYFLFLNPIFAVTVTSVRRQFFPYLVQRYPPKIQDTPQRLIGAFVVSFVLALIAGWRADHIERTALEASRQDTLRLLSQSLCSTAVIALLTLKQRNLQEVYEWATKK
jgi:hypothetical protein